MLNASVALDRQTTEMWAPQACSVTKCGSCRIVDIEPDENSNVLCMHAIIVALRARDYCGVERRLVPFLTSLAFLQSKFLAICSSLLHKALLHVYIVSYG